MMSSTLEFATSEALSAARCEGAALSFRAQMIALLKERGELAFDPNSAGAHFTSSAFILRADGAPLALLHAKLRRWLQPGGHIEPLDLSPLMAARREALEETGLSALIALSPHPVDLDIHTIPARGTRAAHDHFDLRYAFRVEGAAELRGNHESHGLQWLTGPTLERWLEDPSVSRAYHNALELM